MKRTVCLIALFAVLLSGCSGMKEPVTFYYVSEDYREDMSQVITKEQREAAGHLSDLAYLLAMYSLGPGTEGMVSPLPKGTQIIPTEHTEAGIVLSLSTNAQNLSDADFTLAAACLGLTCMELTDAPSVTLTCGERSITVTPENLLLQGTAPEQETEETK